MHYSVRFLTFTPEKENLVTTPLHKCFDAILEDIAPSNRETVVQMLCLSPRPWKIDSKRGLFCEPDSFQDGALVIVTSVSGLSNVSP